MAYPSELQRFFAPRSIAIAGASSDASRLGARLLKRTVRFGYSGALYPLSARQRKVQGLPAWPSIDDLPETPEHVAVAVAPEQVLATLGQCRARGVPCVTVYGAGYAEAGTQQGRALQADIAAFARASGMRILGPNASGFVNYVDGVALTSTNGLVHPRAPAGNVGIVSQSGGLAQINVMWRAQRAGLAISYSVSCGNEADLDACDVAQFMVEGEATQVVLLALGAVRDGAKFMRLAESAAEREKPLVVLKLGRTRAGRRALLAQTGAIAGADAVFDAAFRQFGVIRVDDTRELYEMAIALRGKRWPRGRRAASMSVSGGNIVHLLDAGSALGMAWEPFESRTQARLAQRLPGRGKLPNPIELHDIAAGADESVRAVAQIVARDRNVDVLILLFTFVRRAQIDAFVELAATLSKPVAIVWTGGCRDDAKLQVADLVRSGAAAYADTVSALRCVSAAMGYAEHLARFRKRASFRHPPGTNEVVARQRIARRGRLGLTERKAKEVLAAYGIPVTQERLARSADEAVKHALAIGWPVALKIESPEITHKAAIGGVRLNLDDGQAVRSAYAELFSAARRHSPRAQVNGVLVQAMVSPGLEMMLSMARDAIFGPVIAVGPGGVTGEFLRDVAIRIAPLDKRGALAMLDDLRTRRVLDGVRGSAPRDVEALVDAIVRFSWLAHDLQDCLTELDVNPLVVFEAGACVVDARIALAQDAVFGRLEIED